MGLSFTIAWRNIQRHRGKSLVIGIIIFMGTLIMTIGNGVISGMDKGLKENIMDRFTGNILIVAKNQDEDNIFLNPGGKDLQVLPRYNEIKKLLEQQKYVRAFIPIAKGLMMVLSENEDFDFHALLGVNFEDYFKFFNNNVIPIEGRLLKNGESGILLSQKNRNRMYDFQNIWGIPQGSSLNTSNLSEDALLNVKTLSVRDNVVFMGSSEENAAIDIRTTIRGIIKYEYLNDYWGHFNIIDIESFREAFNYVSSSSEPMNISDEKKKILETDDLDSLFDSGVVKELEVKAKSYNVADVLGRKVVRTAAATDPGTYNMVVIKLKDSDAIERDAKRLTISLEKAGLPARVITWKQSIGLLADMASFIRSALLVFVFLIFFVAIIIIMNTLTMAAMERINEIGMMRAVGAQRSFIRLMFFWETSVLSFMFGGCGIVLGIAGIGILNSLNLTTQNEVLQLLFGGNVFRPLVDIVDIGIGIIELVFVTVIAMLYPVSVAGKITPLEAITRD